MHIGFITSEYSFTNFKGKIGGIGTFLKNFSEQLIKDNHEVSIFIYSQVNNDVISENGIKIYNIKTKKTPFLTWFTNRKNFNAQVNKVVDLENIDVLEAPDWTGFTAFMKFNCPLVIRLHGSDTYFCDLENRKVKFKNKFFEKNALKNADAIIAVSDFVANKTKNLFALKKEIKTIYNTIDVEKFRPNHQKIIPKTLLYYGTIIRKKGVLEIAKTFNKLIEEDYKVNLVFLGNDSNDIKTNTSTLKLILDLLSNKAKQKFKHLNAVPYNEVKEIIYKVEVVLLPSFAEAFPMTWLEAMALEKKLVTSNIGWANELMINGKTGFTINPTNTNEFKERILELLNNEELAMKMAINARKRISKNFNLKDATHLNVKFYKEVLNEV